MVEHNTRHATARGGKARLLDTDDTSIAGVIGREEACKRQPVTGGARMVAAKLVGYLGSTCLTSHLKRFRTGLLSQSLTDHMLQDGLHRLDGLRLGNLLLEHHRLKLLDHLSVLHQPFHESGLHHLAIVGNGIVEGHGIDGRNLRLIADTHPGQRGLTPVFGTVLSFRVGHTDIGWVIAYQRQLQVFVDTHPIESLHIFRGIRAVVFVDNPAHTDVRTYFEGAWHTDGAIAATTPVVVLHGPAVHLHHATTGIDGHGGVYHTIVEGHEERGRLEHGARLAAVTDGIVHHLIILTVVCPLHVHNSLHIARLHLHEDGHTHLAIDKFQLVDQGALRQILHAHIDGGHDVCAIHGREYRDVEVFAEHLTTMHHTVGATQDGVVRQLQTVLGAVLGNVHIADGTSGQRSERTLAGVEGLPVESALSDGFAEDRQFVYFTERVVVHAPAPHGPMARANRTVLHYLSLALQQVGLELGHRL